MSYTRIAMPSIYATRVIIDFLRIWFTENGLHQMETGGRPEVEPIPFAADGTPQAREGLSSLVIRDSWGLNDPADKKKKIVVERGPMRWSSRHIGDFLDRVDIVTRSPTGAMSLQDATRFTDHLPIPVVAYCCAPIKLEADEIADWVFFGAKFSRHLLRERYSGVRDILSADVGSARLVDRPSTKHELVAVPVTLVLDVQFSWTVYERGAQPLRTIELRVTDDPEELALSVEGD